MAKRASTHASSGFSLVEMLVAMVFVLLLMAGMAAVFKASFTGSITNAEKLSSSRRNRMSIDLLYDDLNTAGMYLTDLTNPPPIASSNEAFYVLPDAKAHAGAPIPNVTQGADELYFIMDEALPFEGTLQSTATTAQNLAQLADQGVAASTSDFTYKIDCKDPSYAKQVAVGQTLIFKDAWTPAYIATVNPPSGNSVTVVLGADPNAAISGAGFSGGASNASHLMGSGVLMVNRMQQVRYSIQNLNLDPTQAAASTPCLVRDQDAYASAGFPAHPAGPQAIITENVTGFRVYLSADSGRNWVGGPGYADWAAVKTALNTQLAANGRPGFTSLGNDLDWFRSIPVLVRIDVTTRTAVPRTEYSATPNTLAYKEQIQSLVLLPRHFGLSLN